MFDNDLVFLCDGAGLCLALILLFLGAETDLCLAMVVYIYAMKLTYVWQWLCIFV